MSFAIIELKGYMFQHCSLCTAVVRHVWLCSSHSNVTIQVDAHDYFCKSSTAGTTDNQWLMPGMDTTCRLASRFDFIPGLALGHIKCSYSIEKGIFFQTRCGMRLGCGPGLFCTASVEPTFRVLGAWRTRTHTHLLRTIFANSDVECILRAKTLQIYLTGKGWRSDPRRIEKNVFQGHC